MYCSPDELRIEVDEEKSDRFLDTLEGCLPNSSYKKLIFDCKSSYPWMRKSTADRLCAALKTNHSLTSIYFGGCVIGDNGVVAICEALKTNSTVKDLNLWLNFFNVEGTKAISEMLKVNTTLTHLDIHTNRMRDEEAKILSEGLKVNSTLQSLNLSENEIDDEGGRELCGAIRASKSLKWVSLSKNEMSGSVCGSFPGFVDTSMNRCHPGPVSITTFGGGGTFTTFTHYY